MSAPDDSTVVYHGRPRGSVTVESDAATRDLVHRVRHSPTGFNWGYAGSGPADLARSMLADALGESIRCPDCAGSGLLVLDEHEPQRSEPYSPESGVAADDERVIACGCDDGFQPGFTGLYQDFKAAVIARLPHDQEWHLPRAYVVSWVGDPRNRRTAAYTPTASRAVTPTRATAAPHCGLR